MMGKELCFYIEGQDLYLEQTLVEYMDIPIFFICKGKEQYYVALCCDLNELEYIVVETPVLDIYGLLHGNIPMRDVIIRQSSYWRVTAGEDISSDIVEKFTMDSLDTAMLPEEGACFEIFTKDIESYVRIFDNRFFDRDLFEKKELEIVVNESSAEDVITEQIEQFVDIGDYSAKAYLKNPAIETIQLEGGYVSKEPVNRIVTQEPVSIGWLDDETRNIAA